MMIENTLQYIEVHNLGGFVVLFSIIVTLLTTGLVINYLSDGATTKRENKRELKRIKGEHDG